MNIGQMDRRIRIEQRSTTQEADYGTRADTWTTVATVAAQIQEVLPSKGETQSDMRLAERPARVRIRYLAGLSSDMRIVDLSRSNRVMKIATPPIEIGGRRRWLEFMAADFSTSGAGS